MGLDSAIPIGDAGEPLTFKELQLLSDEQLMTCLQSGQNDALAVLFDRYERFVLSIARKIVRDSGEAEDVTQTVFLDIYRASGQFDPRKGTTKVWLMQYAYHRSLNRRQYLQARNFYSRDCEESDTKSESAHPAGGLNSGESKAFIKQGLSSLPEKQRSVIQMSCFDGFTMEEIAQRMGDSFASVRHNYYRGLQKLRQFISDGRDKQGGSNG